MERFQAKRIGIKFRRAEIMQDRGTGAEGALSRVAVVLHNPRSPENIGAAARAMSNMGISRLVVVAPLRWDTEAMVRLATRKADHLIGSMVIHRELEEALAPFQLVVGTTARSGGLRTPLWSPQRAAKQIIALSGRNDVALLFGPENRGLSNHELRLCHTLVRIPTAKFASLNVAQAVLLICYELHLAARRPHGGPDPLSLASVEELERMYTHLEQTLVKISAIPAHNARHWMMKIRRFLSRGGLQSREVQLIRGLCHQIDWYGNKRAREGPPGREGGKGFSPFSPGRDSEV